MPTLNIDQFNPKKAELQTLAESMTPILAIEIVGSKTYKQVHEAQMTLRENRISIEKQGKELREEATTFAKTVISVEKELISVISPIEEELKAKKEAYDKEQDRIKQELEAQKQAKITARIQALAQYGITYDSLDHGTMSDTLFDNLISAKKQEFEESEKIRLEQIENERIAREKFEEDQRKFREEQAEVARKNKEAQDKIDADRKAIEDEKNAIEKARIDAENIEKARLQGIEDEKIRKEREEIEAKRVEKEEQEKLAKKKKYVDFCGSIGLSEDTKSDFTFIDTNEGRVFYKKVGIYRK